MLLQDLRYAGRNVWHQPALSAAVVLVVVIGAATRERQLSVSGLLLSGIAINSIAGAMILLVHGLSGMSQSFAISRWLIGSLDAIEFSTLALYAVAVAIVGFVVMRQARQWNLVAIGEAWAATRGATVQRSLVTGYVCGSVLAAATVAEAGLERGMPKFTLLNINVAAGKNKGIRVTVQAKRNHMTAVNERHDPKGRPYFWIEEGQYEWHPHDLSDYEMARDGYVSVTPLHPDLTAHHALADVERLFVEKEAGVR